MTWDGLVITGGSALLAFLGLACLYFAYFLYESEEERVQRRLEIWWINLGDTGQSVSRRLARLATATSAKLDDVLLLVFGPTLMSLRALWPAAFLAHGGMLIVAGIAAALDDSTDVPLAVSMGIAAVGTVILLVGLVPMRFKSPAVIRVGCTVTVVIWLLLAGLLFVVVPSGVEVREALFGWAGITSAVACGAFLYLGLVIFIRGGIRRTRTFEKLGSVVMTLLIEIAVISGLVFIPNWLFHRINIMKPPETRSEQWLVLMLLLEGIARIAIAVSWIFCANLAILMLYTTHRILWPLFPRLVYTAQRHRLIEKRSLLGKAGVLLLLASGIPVFAWIATAVLQPLGMK